MTPNPLIYRSKTPEMNTFLSLGHMNNLLLNLSDKTQLLNGIRLRRVERSRRRTKMLLIYLPFVSGFPGNFFFWVMVSELFIPFIVWTVLLGWKLQRDCHR